MLDFLKNSKGKILALFFKDPEKEYYLREIAQKLGKEPGYFQSHLQSLVKEQILLDERKANLRYFHLNKNHPLYNEIKKIISKTFGIEHHLRNLVEQFDTIKYSFIFGSIAKDTEITDSDIDLMLIGKINEDELMQKLEKLEKELSREINYHIFETKEFQENLEKNNDFINRILKEPKIILKGNLNELTTSTIN